MFIAIRAFVFAAGVFCVFATVGSAVRTVVLPRGVPVRLTSAVFRTMRRLLELRLGRGADYRKRDRVMAVYAPIALLTLLFSWLVLVLAGYTAIYWALDPTSLSNAFLLSGSSLFTLGIATGATIGHAALTFSEAALGLLLLALLITYLPSLYAAFSRRELVVAMLEIRASSPPEAYEMLARFHRIHGLDRLHELWGRWEAWFVELEETHTSFPALAFFRSPQPEHSWVTAAGAILDAASFRASTLEGRDADADLCIRAGYLALRRIAGFFRIPFNPDPKVGDPISITKNDFDEMYDRLAGHNLPLREDREQAWLDFWGWRVNYDEVLLGLARLTMAPPAPWSTDKLGANLTKKPPAFEKRERGQ